MTEASNTIDLRERLRLLMLAQPTTGKRETYSDGYAMGLCAAIEMLDAALPTEASEPVGLDALKTWFNALPCDGIGKEHYDELIRIVTSLSPKISAERVRVLEEALRGVIAVADRKTVEFDRARAALSALPPAPVSSAVPVAPRPVDEWSERDGNVVWWCWRDGAWLGEPAYIGTPLDLGQTVEVTLVAVGVDKLMRATVGGWPGYHTHWTPHPQLPADLTRSAANG